MATTSKRAASAPTKKEVAAALFVAFYGALADKILDLPDGAVAERAANEACDAAEVFERVSGERA